MPKKKKQKRTKEKAKRTAIKHKKTKKAIKKAVPRKFKKIKTIKHKPTKEQAMFEEVVYKCPGCGRELRVVKVSGYDITSMLCQRCAMGGELMEEE